MKKSAKARTRLSPEARKNHLLDVSKSMIVTDGLQEFSMEALARAADVSSPLVYNYFDSRLDTLRCLLVREYEAYASRLSDEVAQAKDFEAVVRLNIESNFDHYAPGNIIPVLASQPEIAVAIREQSKKNGRDVARYLVGAAAHAYNLTSRQAELLVSMSSGASIAAAEYASRGRIGRAKAVNAALAYILAGLEQSSTNPT